MAPDAGGETVGPDAHSGKTWAQKLGTYSAANFFNFVPWTACLNYILEAGPERIVTYDQQIVEKLVRGVRWKSIRASEPGKRGFSFHVDCDSSPESV
jgi:hypothetical protein